MKQSMMFAVVTVAVMFLNGCNPAIQTERPVSKPAPVQKETKVTLENVKKIRKGMSYEEVKEILGPESKIMEKNEDKKAGIYAWDGETKQSFVIITFSEDKMITVQQQGLQ